MNIERVLRIEELRRKQPEDELLRKRLKAMRRGCWTQEDIDHAHVAGTNLFNRLFPQSPQRRSGDA